MMKIITAIVVSLSVLIISLTPGAVRADGIAASAGFFSGIDDLPLMPGLTELPDATLVFDSPSGRFVEAYAFGKISLSEVKDFYSSSLPQLGWNAADSSSYQREGEMLEITAVSSVAEDGTLTVRFAISPSGDGARTN